MKGRYIVSFADKKVLKQFENLPGEAAEKIKKALLELRTEPRPQGTKNLAGKIKDSWRIRVGSWRAIYDIDDKLHVVSIIEIGHRREIYR